MLQNSFYIEVYVFFFSFFFSSLKEQNLNHEYGAICGSMVFIAGNELVRV